MKTTDELWKCLVTRIECELLREVDIFLDDLKADTNIRIAGWRLMAELKGRILPMFHEELEEPI